MTPEKGTTKLEIRNDEPHPLEILIEMTPDRYVLQQGDKMVIDAQVDGIPFTVVPHKNGLQIYAGNDSDPVVTINGVVAETDWSTPA